MVIDLHVLRVSSPDLALHLSKRFVDWAGLFAAIGAKQSIASALRGAPLVAVPFYYIHRNLRARRVTTLLTIGGMALVVFVFATMRMLAEGIKQTLVDTGRGDNVMVIRRSAETEVQSSVDREQAAIVESLPHIAQGAAGERYASKESLVLLVLPKRGSGKPSNVTIRGLSTPGLWLRPQVRVVQGRMFRPGTAEIIAGVKIAQGFGGTGLGERIRLGGREWTVVGLFDAGNSGFSSEG